MSRRKRFHQRPERTIQEVEREYRPDDSIARSQGVRMHYGSIEAAEEKRFPWLRKRRGR